MEIVPILIPNYKDCLATIERLDKVKNNNNVVGECYYSNVIGKRNGNNR